MKKSNIIKTIAVCVIAFGCLGTVTSAKTQDAIQNFIVSPYNVAITKMNVSLEMPSSGKMVCKANTGVAADPGG